MSDEEKRLRTDESTWASDVDESIDLLRDQVDKLQIDAARGSKPWYRNPPFVMSVVALGVSVFFSWLSVDFRNEVREEESRRATLNLLRSNITALADLQLESTEAYRRNSGDAVTQADLNSAYNAKRQVLIEETEDLLERAEDVSSAMYVNFGYQLLVDGRLKGAEAYFQRGLQVAQTSLARSTSLRALALAAMVPGNSPEELADGREYWRRALNELRERTDDNAIGLRADHLRWWAFHERNTGHPDLADSLIAEARELVEQLSPLGGGRAHLEALLTQPFTGSPTEPMTAGGLEGDWAASFEDGSTGTLTMTPSQEAGGWFVQAALMDEGGVVEVRQGNAPMQGGGLVISWQGHRETGLQPEYTVGVTRLVFASDGRLEGMDERLGEAAQTVSLARVDPTQR